MAKTKKPNITRLQRNTSSLYISIGLFIITLCTNHTLKAQTNTAYGTDALKSGSSTFYNSAFGCRALSNTSIGRYNTAIGYDVLSYGGSSGWYNTATGANALFRNSSGSNNTASGYQSLYFNTIGFNNVASGSNALHFNKEGSNNTASGRAALYNNTTGQNNTASGESAIYNNTTGSFNTASGKSALYSTTIGNNNTASGVNALYTNTEGSNNTANGRAALYNNTTGQSNTASGESSLYNSTTGSFNTASGVNALVNNVTGSNNAALGFAADVSTGNLTNATAIGAGANVNASNKIRLGDVAVTEVETQFKYTTVSDGRFKNNISQEDIKGLEFIKKLRPVAYNFDTRKFQEHITQNMPTALRKQYMNQDFSASIAVRRSGFIAQEVEKAAEEAGYDFDGVSKPQGAGGNYSLAYSQFVVPLVKAVQELDKKNEQLQKEKEQQQKINDQLQQRLETLEKLITGANSLTQQPVNKTIPSSETESFNLYPNPTTGIFTITANNITNATIEVYDALGNKVKKDMLANIKSGYQLNLSGCAKGTYWVNIISGNKKYTKQIAVR